jgi:hypothetical protein
MVTREPSSAKADERKKPEATKNAEFGSDSAFLGQNPEIRTFAFC